MKRPVDPVLFEEAAKSLEPKKLFYPDSFKLAADAFLHNTLRMTEDDISFSNSNLVLQCLVSFVDNN